MWYQFNMNTFTSVVYKSDCHCISHCIRRKLVKVQTHIIIAPSFIISFFNHHDAIPSRILHHCVYCFTICLGASVETIQSCSELGGKTGGKEQTTCTINSETTFVGRRMQL